ncbi:hypothetical protein AB0E08_07925 [Streptomyces sp. NPDC048281]|uniref:hypothetical protein n=1 Tax=Streptomyces sp. NPDC048281 TaxID=3154715 RepID=UPI00344806ED
MSRVESPAKKTTPAPKKMTAREKRIAQATAGVTTGEVAPARRGEDDDLTAAAQAAASTPAETPPVPRQTASEPLEGVVHPREPEDPFQYVPAPDDASDLVHLAHAERQIRKVGDAAGNGFAEIETNYWNLTGRWLAEVQEKGSYKAGGHKSVERFAHSIGLERHTYYRAIKHYVVYGALGGLVTAPLAQNVVDQLYTLGKDDRDLLRTAFVDLTREGSVTVSAVKNLRRLIAASEEAAKPPKAIATREPRPVTERLQEARGAGKIDLGLIKELVAVGDRQSAQEYVDDMKKKLAEAEGLLSS